MPTSRTVRGAGKGRSNSQVLFISFVSDGLIYFSKGVVVGERRGGEEEGRVGCFVSGEESVRFDSLSPGGHLLVHDWWDLSCVLCLIAFFLYRVNLGRA